MDDREVTKGSSKRNGEKGKTGLKQLISMVKARPLLWNSAIEGSEDKERVDRLWEEIDQVLDKPKNTAKLNFQVLQEKYVQEHKEAKRRSGSSKWPLYGSLDFLSVALRHYPSKKRPKDDSESEWPKKRQRGDWNDSPTKSPKRIVQIDDTDADDEDGSGFAHASSISKDLQMQVDLPNQHYSKQQSSHVSSKGSVVETVTTVRTMRNEDADCDDENESFLPYFISKLNKVPRHLLDRCHMDLLQVVLKYRSDMTTITHIQVDTINSGSTDDESFRNSLP